MNKIITAPPPIQVSEPDSFEKGFQFENYIVTLFNQRNFRLIEWRSDKEATNGVRPLSCSWPDLVFSSKGKKKLYFAIECKWRKRFFEGGTDWADRSKIDSYLDYQREWNIRVLVAIGIGGQPSNPEQLFITPLDHISKYPFVFQSHLIPFKRIFLSEIEDVEQLKLFD
jgi:hypothetical protein